MDLNLLEFLFDILKKDSWLIEFIFWELNFFKIIGYDINYQDYQPQEATGSTSGSFERKPDKDVLSRPGNFFFHSDYNALGYTYQSASIYSQSIDFVTCYYSSASAATLVATASTGFITQSHYCYTTVVCYITGSYT